MVARPRYADLSPDLQYQVWRNQQIRSQLEWLLLVPFLLYLLVPNVNRWVDQYIGVRRDVNVEDNRSAQPVEVDEDFKQTLKKGDVVAGIPVTSPFGDRSDRAHALPPGASLWHKGVDLGTFKGTPVHAIGQSSVSCFWDGGGGGNVAEVLSSEASEYRFLILHLDSCTPGEYNDGEVFAYTGDTGIGAEHVDFRQQQLMDDIYIDPYKGFVEWFLTGANPMRSVNGTDVYDLLVEDMKASEGLVLDAYLDPVGIWTIGFGATYYPDGSPIQPGDSISEEEAVDLLKWHYSVAENHVNEAVKVPLEPHEKAALIDFTYNAGGGALKESTLLRKLNAGDRQGAADEFLKWVNGANGPLPGLVTRREKNRKMFLGEHE